MKQLFFLLLVSSCAAVLPVNAQLSERWFGTWSGTMYIFNAGTLRDSVQVTFTARPLPELGSYIWKTEYHSAKMPMVKDYRLRVRDGSKGLYVTDEGDGIELTTYLVGDKMYSVFAVQNVMLTATYELKGNELVFEVGSGKKEPPTGGGVTTYSVSNLQRVIFRRVTQVDK
jgi:hypothetical protein